MPYSRDVHRVSVMFLVLAVSHPAGAGGLAIVGGSPRAIGRAGAGTVGDDGGGALLVNPAAMARRDGTRVQLGAAFVDDSIAWKSDNPDAPVSRDQGGSSIAPLGAVVGSIGSWVLGAGVMTSAVTSRTLRDPNDVLEPDDLRASFDYRYTGIAGSVRRDTVTIGAARRIGESLAIGIAVGASRVSVSETRRLWAGFNGITSVGDPHRDVEIAMTAVDDFSPSAIAGILIAPPDTPLELGASLSWSAFARAEGTLIANGTDGGPTVRTNSPIAQLVARQPVTARAGVRYLGERFTAELGGDVWIAPRGAGAATWRVRGVQIVDPSTVRVELLAVPSRLSLRTHGAIRATADVELIAGFLWATGGYAFTVGGTTETRLSTTFGDLGGTTWAAGLEGAAGGFTFTVGWSRTWAMASPGGQAFSLDNPFGAGDATVPSGTYDATSDQLGILLDVELDRR